MPITLTDAEAADVRHLVLRAVGLNIELLREPGSGKGRDYVWAEVVSGARLLQRLGHRIGLASQLPDFFQRLPPVTTDEE